MKKEETLNLKQQKKKNKSKKNGLYKIEIVIMCVQRDL
jgi:hypothetical protein